jgi:PAS domain S-box-containing protein
MFDSVALTGSGRPLVPPGPATRLPRLRFSILLLGLVLAVLLPALGAGVVAIWYAVAGERAAAEARLTDTAEDLALAVDQDIAGQIATLTAFAASPAFGRAPAAPDLPALYANARRVADQLGVAVGVFARDGTYVLNTGRPLGTPLPPVNGRAALEHVFATGRPAVGDLVMDSIVGRFVIAVAVPVYGADGRVALVVDAALEPEGLRTLLRAAGVPDGAFAAVTDARGVVVARSDSLHEAVLGRPISPESARAIAGRQQSFFRIKATDDVERVFAFHKLSVAASWSLVVAQPAATYDAAWRKPLLALGGGAALALALGIGLASLAAQQVLVPLRQIVGYARAVALSDEAAGDSGDAGTLPRARVAELEALRSAFATAEAALRRKTDELQALFRASPIGIARCDFSGRVLDANDVLLRILGVTRDDLAAGRVRWDALIPPECRGILERAIAEALANPDGRCRPYEKEFVRPDGTLVPVLNSFAVLDRAAGEAAVFVMDLTEIRGQEARLRGLLNTVMEGIIVASEDGLIISVNPAAVRMFGYASEADMVGRPLGILMPKFEAAHHDGYLAHHRATGAARVIGLPGRELIGFRKDGSEFPVDLSVSSFRSGNARFFTGVLRDITERKQAEAAERHAAELERQVKARTRDLEETQAQLAQAAKMEALGRLAGGVAHDFNNVLQAVEGGLALADKHLRSNPARAQSYLAISASAAERGAAVAGRLLGFARRGELSAAPVAPLPLLDGVLQLLRPTFGPTVSLGIEAEPATPALYADIGRLESVLVNLANNSRDALARGVGTIRLTAATATAPGDAPARLMPGNYVRLSVIDDGMGMSPEVLARVTEPFFTTKPQGQGTGLGLAMARGFAEQSGGALTIESASGQGTTVSLWLPVAPGEVDGDSWPEATRPDTDTPDLHGVAMLLVDDEPDVRAVLAALLAERGYMVTEAADAASALAILGSGLVADVLVTDLAMPGDMDGLALVREVRRRRPGLPAVLVTGNPGNAGDAAIKQAAGSGPFVVLPKPFSAKALDARVAALLHS